MSSRFSTTVSQEMNFFASWLLQRPPDSVIVKSCSYLIEMLAFELVFHNWCQYIQIWLQVTTLPFEEKIEKSNFVLRQILQKLIYYILNITKSTFIIVSLVSKRFCLHLVSPSEFFVKIGAGKSCFEDNYEGHRRHFEISVWSKGNTVIYSTSCNIWDLSVN